MTVTVPIAPIVPSHNVYLTNFSIVPDLPAGLVLDPATGVISGTPTQVSAATRYTVSVPDGKVAETATLVITVNPLASGINDRFNLVHATDVGKIDRDGNTRRVLVLDMPLRAVLWSATTGVSSAPTNQTCSTTGPCTVDGAFAGPTVVIRERTGWNTYSAVDGALIAHLDIAPGFATAWTLARDGSYLLFAGVAGVQAVTPQGTMLFTRAGDYLTAEQGSSYLASTRFDTSTGDAVRIGVAQTPFSAFGPVAGDYVWFVAVQTRLIEGRE